MPKWAHYSLTIVPITGTISSMKLATYLSTTKTTHEAFAEKLGVSSFAVGKWAREQRVPRRGLMSRISEATNGAVTANDFFTPPRETQREAS